MTNLQIESIKKQIRKGEKLDRIYRPFEGGIRAIGKDARGCETRYAVILHVDGDVTLKEM